MSKMAFIDMEGVLIPEIWLHIAESLKIHELKITIREVPNYHKLMINRINLLKEHKVRLCEIKRLMGSAQNSDHIAR